MFGTVKAMAAGAYAVNSVVLAQLRNWKEGAVPGAGEWIGCSWLTIEQIAARFNQDELMEALTVIRGYRNARHVRGAYVGDDLKFVNAAEFNIQIALGRQLITMFHETSGDWRLEIERPGDRIAVYRTNKRQIAETTLRKECYKLANNY